MQPVMRNPTGQLQDGLLNRAGVFWVNVNGAALECLEANEGAAQGEATLDGEATILQELGHDLGQHLSLDILLATDDDRAFQARFCQGSGAARRMARTQQMQRHQVRSRQVRLSMIGPSRLEVGQEEIAHELIRRRVDNLIARSMLGEAAALENDEPLRQSQRFVQIMRNQYDGMMVRGSDCCKFRNSCWMSFRITGSRPPKARRAEKRRLEHHRPAQADTLLLTTGQLVRVAGRKRPRQADALHQLLSAARIRSASQPTTHANSVIFRSAVRCGKSPVPWTA